jgi:hypothetical protein
MLGWSVVLSAAGILLFVSLDKVTESWDGIVLLENSGGWSISPPPLASTELWYS